MALMHRMRRQPFDDPDMNSERLQEMAQDILNSTPPDAPQPDMGDVTPPEAPQGRKSSNSIRARTRMCFSTGESFQVKPVNLDALDKRARASHGRRTVSRVRDHRGRYVGAAMPDGKVTDLAVDATVRAASPFQLRRGGFTDGSLALKVEAWDLRQKVRESRVGNLVVVLVDSSGSMGAQQRMVAAKGAVISLLMDAYQRRDRVAMIAFRGTKSEVVLPPTGSPEAGTATSRQPANWRQDAIWHRRSQTRSDSSGSSDNAALTRLHSLS